MATRWLLRLVSLAYPRIVRRDHGDELRALLAHHLDQTRQRYRVVWPVAFLMRVMADAWWPEGAPELSFGRELRWAVRGVRARGLSAVLSVVLVACAAAASTLVFTSADGLIFNRVPFPEPERLVRIGGNLDGATFDELRRQTDVLSDVGGYQQPSATFLETPVGLMDVASAGVAVGTFETLGIMPRWGRTFVDADRLHHQPNAVVLEAALAERLFGAPELAVGQSLTASGEHLDVVGVMPPGFGYPYGNVVMWRVIDHLRLPPLAKVISTARLAPGVWHTQAMSALTPRFPTLVSKQSQTFQMVPETFGNIPESRRALFAVLLGAALCLLVAVCANVVNLELILELRRAQALSIRLALGASRASLVTSAILESVLLMLGALVLAAGLTMLGAGALQSMLPEDFTAFALQTITINPRAWWFLVGITAAAWMPSTASAVFHASGSSVSQILKSGRPRATRGRTGRGLRHGIMAAQTALTVVLLVGGIVYVRAYLDRLSAEPGFDAGVVAEIEVRMPTPEFTVSSATDLKRHVVERVSTHHAVEAVVPLTLGVPPEGAGINSVVAGADGVAFATQGSRVEVYFVDAGFFRAFGLTLLGGRGFTDNDPLEHIVIGESLARKLWPTQDAVGRRLEIGKVMSATVAGVVPDVRLWPYIWTDGTLHDREPVYVPARREPSFSVSKGRGYLNAGVLVRLSNPAQLDQVLDVARASDPRAMYTAELLSDRYFRIDAPARMAASIMTVFALMAAMIAVAGVFGVMAFLVASRRREFGICLALGADQRRLQTQVLGTSLKLVAIGVAVGIGGAILGERVIGASLPGVAGAGPLTYAAISAAVIVATLAATWGPARQAARIDPTVTLRAE